MSAYADAVHLSKCTGELLGTDDPGAIAKEMKKQAASRNAYFTYYTGKHLSDAKNWHLSLDTGTLGYDTCVDLICRAAAD